MTRFLLICSFLQKQMKILLYVSLFETRFLWCLFLIELCQSQHIYKVFLCVTGNVSSMRLLHSFKICVFDTFCFLSLLAYLQLLKLTWHWILTNYDIAITTKTNQNQTDHSLEREAVLMNMNSLSIRFLERHPVLGHHAQVCPAEKRRVGVTVTKFGED